MELEQSSLYREVQSVLQSPSKPIHYAYTAVVHANELSLVPLKLISLDIVQNFEMNYGDELMVKLLIPGGMYAKKIYPFQANLEITLTRTPLLESSDVNDPDGALQSERYFAQLIDRGSPIIEGNGPNAMDETALDLTNQFELEFQLINKAVELMRVITVGGNFRQTTTEDAVKAILTREIDKLKIEAERRPKGVDMVPASNTKKREHIVIPQATQLVAIPAYIHKHCGGIYSAGLGYYFHGDYWYLYPCYDTKRFTSASRTLTVINVPKNKFPNIERTYKKDNGSLTILATGEAIIRDDSDKQQLNLGNGVRFADANKFMDGFVNTKENKTVAARGKNNSEFTSVKRENGINNVQLSQRAINANPYVEYSALARRQGGVFSLVWENSNPSLIFPGMMSKIMYLDGDEIKEIFGVVLVAHHYVHMRGRAITDTRHVTHTALSIFINQPRS